MNARKAKAALKRVANLNPDAGTIGDGMLRTIVQEARDALSGQGPPGIEAWIHSRGAWRFTASWDGRSWRVVAFLANDSMQTGRGKSLKEASEAAIGEQQVG